MLFTDYYYLFAFLPLAVLGHHWVHRRWGATGSKIFLAAASLFFYGYWSPIYLLLLIGSILINYYLGLQLTRIKEDRGRAGILIIGILANLAPLIVFKYSPTHWVLPLAISFFTFQQIAFLVDCYKRRCSEPDFVNYGLFVTFFPHLIAGPIVHHQEMMPQFAKPSTYIFNETNAARGLLLFAIGLFKKAVVADSLGLWSNAGFAGPDQLHWWGAWLTSFSYSLQLYFDFSGYSDMALGAALMFNVRLPANFNSPYKAADIQDFWRRWHMTLSRWLREYIYIPLGGNRFSQGRTMFNLFVTFLIGGLWHGAGWTFFIWGLLHGVGVVAHRVFHNSGLRMNWIAGRITLLLYVNLAWVFFRAPNVDTAWRLIQKMAGVGPVSVGETSPFVEWPPWTYAGWMALAIVIVLMAPNSNEWVEKPGGFRLTRRAAVGTGLLVSAALTFLMMSHGTEFLYFNF